MLTPHQLKKAIAQGGMTLDNNLEPLKIDHGYCVCILGFSKKFFLSKISLFQLYNVILDYKKNILPQNYCLGIFMEGNLVWVTSNKILEEKDKAIQLGILNKQDSIYDFYNQRIIYIK